MKYPLQSLRLLGAALFLLAFTGVTGQAQAQYKNFAFGFQAGPSILLGGNNNCYYQQTALVNPVLETSPPLVFGNNQGVALGFKLTPGTCQPEAITDPARLQEAGVRTKPNGPPFYIANATFHFEFSLKLSPTYSDRFWLKTGFNLGFIRVLGDKVFNSAADDGHAVWLEGMIGPRIFILTDRIRPYFEFGLRLGGLTNLPNPYIAHPKYKLNIMPAVYGTFAVEFMAVRDVAITVGARYSYVFFLDFPGFHLVEPLVGFNVYF